MASNDWYSSKELLQAVKKFHCAYARQPQQQISEAKARLTPIIAEIDQYMRSLGILVRCEYTGSTYEGTKVAKSPDDYDLEFDVMFIIDSRGKGLQIEKMPQRAGFAKLKRQGQGATAASGSNTLFGHLDGDFLNAQRTADKFFGQLQKCINESSNLSRAVTLRRHGPAAQMDVKRQGGTAIFFSVDVVPTYEVNHERYVAKPVMVWDEMPDNLAWRRSFSIEEKELLVTADRDNGCRKKVFRILKVIKNREPGLAPLTSYHLKTALFWEMKELSGTKWLEEDLGKMLMGVLGQLEKRLDAGNLPHYFLGNAVNLLSPIPSKTVENMRDRIRRLRNSEIEMKRILKT